MTMDRSPDFVELQTLQPHGTARDADTGPASVSTGHLLPAPMFLPHATSSAGNSSTQINLPKPQNAKPTIWKNLKKWWLEIAGAISSIVLLIIIVVFLVLVDDSKLDDWHLAWQIEPPTVISILVTLCRINLAFFIAEGIGQLKWVFFEQREHQLSDFDRFDEATRGPWGATCFIWKVNRRALVATCGAIMAILILAMDPFSQQVLYYASQASSIENAVVTIPSAQFYDSGALYAALSGSDKTASYDPDPKPPSPSDPSTFGSTPPASDVPGLATFGGSGSVKRGEPMPISSQGTSNCSDTLMARAAYAGLFTSVPPAEFACPSGNNCTWFSFTTLGICSKCNDITSRVKATCNTEDEYDICWYELIGPGDLPGNASYPGRDTRPYVPGMEGDTTKFLSMCSGSGVTKWPLWFTWASNVWDKSRDLLSFTSYRFPLAAASETSQCKLPKAHVEQCSLYWCAKTFDSAAVTSGKMDEGPSNDVRLVPFNATNTTCPGLRTTKAPERKAGIPMQGLIREDRACPMSSEDIGPSDIFWVNENDHVMTVNMLSPMIWAKEMFVDPNGAVYGGDESDSAASDPAVATALWDNHGGDLSLTLADIATAMTNRVRLADGHVDVDGSSTANHTVIKVVWYWLIYMVAMVLLSLTFFVTAMVFASEKSQVVWKSSSLAVLMHGLEGFDRTQLDYKSLTEMDKAAKALWAQLREDDEGSLRLVRHT